MGTNRVCPVAIAGGLDNTVRRWFQNPQKMLRPYVKQGMTVLDVGCGPGFFSVDIARMVGPSGQVIAADMQEGMLQILRRKIRGTELEERIVLHQCEERRIGIVEQVDFVLAFYMVHEVPHLEIFFTEIESILKTNGSMFIVEPPFHVSKRAFDRTIERAREAGLIADGRPKMLFHKTVVLKKG